MLKSKKKQDPNVASKPKKKLKKKSLIIITVIALICIGGIAFSVYKIVTWNIDNHKTKAITKELKNVIIEEVEPDHEEDPNTEIVDAPENKEDLYWKYKDMPLIDVDINKLKAEENSDTVGWIQVPGTSINYPIVQSGDNNYYLTHDYKKNYNSAGWVYLDYRNDIDNLKSNNIIYGHRMYNQSVFGTLKNVLTSSWQNNTDNHIIRVSTAKNNYLFQVFSIHIVYGLPTDNFYIRTLWATPEDYKAFLDDIVSRSVYNFNTEVNENTKILTLSTCHNTSDKLVVHAKLIKVQNKG